MLHPPHLTETTAHLVHFIFEWAGVLSGVQVYRHIKHRKQQNIMQGANFNILIACILGAGLLVINLCLFWSLHNRGWKMAGIVYYRDKALLVVC